MKSLVGWLTGLRIQVSTAVVIALAILLTMLVWSVTRNPRARWTAALVGPFAVASCVHFLPVWLGADPSEHAAWARVFIGIWGLTSYR